MSKIRLLHVIGGLGVGGCETQLLEMCRRMDREQFDISLLSYSIQPETLEGAFTDVGVHVITMDKFSMPLWRFFGKLRRTIRDVAPDVIHTWLYSANFWGRWAGRAAGYGEFLTSDRAEVRSSTWYLRLSEKLLAPRTIRLANSRFIADSLYRHYRLPPGSVRVIYNAVEVPPCDPPLARAEIRRELAVPEGQKLVVMLARQVPIKNYPMFLRTCRRVCAERPDVTFLAVGRQEMQDELDALARELDIVGRIRFVGQRRDINRWLTAADVACMTSDSEGFPNAVLEAMSVGLPVVCTRLPSVIEMVGERNLVELVPFNDDTAMAQRVLGLLSDPDRAAAVGNAGRAYVHENFSWDRLVRTMSELYTQVAARTTGRRGSQLAGAAP